MKRPTWTQSQNNRASKPSNSSNNDDDEDDDKESDSNNYKKEGNSKSILKGRYDSFDNVDVDNEEEVNDDDDDDDRKPPARIITSSSSSNVSVLRTNENGNDDVHRQQQVNRDNDNNDHDDASDEYGNSTYTPTHIMPPNNNNDYEDDNWIMISKNKIHASHHTNKDKKKHGTSRNMQNTSSEVAIGTLPPIIETGIMASSMTLNSSRNPSLPMVRQELSLMTGINNNISSTDIRIFMLWGSVFTLSSSFLIYELIPMNVQVAFITIIISMIILIRNIYEILLRLYDRMIVNGNGIGELLLPSSLYQILTQQSLHNLLLFEDNTADCVEIPIWMNIIIYFLPSLSNEQKIQYISRLPEHQRNTLYRDGIGYWIPIYSDTIMRLILGNQRYEEQNNRHHRNNNISMTTAATTNHSQLLDEGLNWSRRRQPPPLLQEESQQPPEFATQPFIDTPTVLSSIGNSMNNTPPLRSDQNRLKKKLYDSDDDSSVESDLGLDISSEMEISDQHATLMTQSLGIIIPSSPIVSTLQERNEQRPNQVQSAAATTTNGNVVIANHNTNIAATTTTATTSIITSTANQPNILFDAMNHSLNTVMNEFVLTPARNITTNIIIPTITNTIQRWNIRLFIITSSINIFGYWSGIYRNNPFSTVLSSSSWIFGGRYGSNTSSINSRGSTSSTNSMLSSIYPTLSSIYPTSRTIWTITAISGATSLGLALYHRSHYLATTRSTTTTTSGNGDTTSQQNPMKKSDATKKP